MTSLRAVPGRAREREGPDSTAGHDQPNTAVERLIHEVAAALGVDLASLTVRADGEATTRVRARAASGLAAGATILLDGERFGNASGGPIDRWTRELVAHEVVHVAQRDEGGRAAGRRRPNIAAAEREAHRLARRFADGRPLPRPVATLPGGHIAADVDWAGLNALLAALDSFDEHVAASRPYEWQTLQDAVNADDSVSAGQADLIVRTLSAVPLPVIRALLRLLPPRSRGDVVRQLTAEHFEVHRPVAIGALAALNPDYAATVDADLLQRIDLLGLSQLEHDVLLLALADVPAAVLAEILEHETDHPDAPQHWHELVHGEGVRTTPVVLIEGLATEQAAAERQSAEQRAAQEAEVDRHVHELARMILRDEEGALEAVSGIARLSDEVRPLVVRALDDQGQLARLVDVVDDHDGAGGPLAGADFGAVMAARTTAASLATINDRLSGGLFGWDWTEDIAITQADAMVAFWAIAALPLDVRERLLRSSDADPLDKMERNLPEWFVDGDAYRSLAVSRDRSGSLYERGERHRAAWEREGTAGFLVELRRMISARRHADVLVALDTGRITEQEPQPRALGATPPVSNEIDMTDQVRAALVDRLDALDVMEGFLEDLPYEIRQGRDHRLELLRVCSARSVPNLLRHLSSLLHTGLDDTAVRSWEADLAYVLYRALPPYEQVRYRHLDDITREMSADIRTWSGTNLLDAATATAQLAQVRHQLGKDELWRASRAGELRVLVGMAVALGDRRTPFERSSEVEACRDPSLREIVRDFRLYDPEAGRTEYVEERLRNTPWYNEGPDYWSTLIFGFIWMALRDAFAGQFVFDLSNGRTGLQSFDLNEMTNLLGGHAGGARFAARRDTERGRERNPDVTERANRAGIHYDQRNNALHLSIPELAIEGLGILRAGWAANTGAIRVQGLTLDATFDPSNLRHPRHVALDMPSVSVSDLLVTTPESAYAAARIGLNGFLMSGAPATVDEHATTGSGFWTYIPVLGALVEWVYLLFQTLGLGMNSATQLGAGLTELRSARVSVAGVDVRGLLVKGTPIEQVSFGPITLGWGGTRAAYLREQERALVDRVATAPEGARRDRLIDQLARVRQELPAALDDDRSLDELIRRSHRDPASLTTADHDEIRRLQHGPGGMVIDTGTIELRGIGDLAERATIQRISGEVAAAAATGGRLTDAALADRFRSAGPPVGIGDRLAAAGGLDLGDVDVTLRPPSLVTLYRWHREAEAAGGTKRAARIDLAIEQRQELDRLRSEQDRRIRAGEPPSATDAARIEELLGLLATSIHAQDVSAQVDLTTGVVTLGAERITGGPIDTSQFGAGRVDVEGIRIPISMDPSGLPAFMLLAEQTEGMSDEARAQLYGDRIRETLTGAGLSVRRATLTDVRVGAGDSAIGEIAVNGVRGGVITPVEEGVQIRDFHVDSIIGRGAQIRLGAHSIDAPGGVAIEGISASFTILLGEDHSFQGARIDTARIEAVRVLQPEQSADAPAVAPGVTSPAPLSYTNLESGFSVELFNGALGGIWFENVLLSSTEAGIEVRSSAEGERTGDRPMGGIERIDALRLAASVGGWRVATTITSPDAGTGPAGAITVGEARQGGWFLDLNGLRFTDSEIRSPDGSVRVRRLDWAHSHLRYDGAGIYLDALDIPLVEVGALRWRIGSGGILSSVGGATIRGITATARARLVEREGETRSIAEFVLPELRIGSITAEDLHYTDGPIDIQLRRLGPTDPAPVTINDIVVSDVRWAPGDVTRFDVRTGAVGLAVDAGSGRPGAALADRDWGFIGQLHAGGLHLAQDQTGLTAGATELGAAGDFRVAGLGGAHLDVAGINLPALTFGGNVISVPATAAGMLRIRALELTAMRFEAGGATISTPQRSNVRLEELQTGFDIHLVQPRGGPTRRLDSIVLHQVDATRLSTTGLYINVPGAFSATLSSAGRRSDVSGIHIRNLRLDAVAQPGSGYRLQMSSFDEVRVDHLELHDLAFRAPLGITLGEEVPEPIRRAQAQDDYAQFNRDQATGVATTEDWIGAFSELIDSADGTIHVDLTLPILLQGVDLGGRINATIGIRDGEVNFKRLEEEVLEKLNIADAAIDFEVVDDTLIIELDLTDLGALLGLPGLVAGAHFSAPLVTWDLVGPGELFRAEEHSMVRVTRLLVPRRNRPSTDPSPVEIDLGPMVLNTLDVNLSLNNDTAVTVDMPSGHGWLRFAPNALHGLRLGIGAGIPQRGNRPAGHFPLTPPARAGLSFSLNRLALHGASLNLPIGTLSTGAMSVSDIRNGGVNLERLAMPETPTTADRPHDTALGLRLVDVSGHAGTVHITDLVLTPGGTGGP